MIHPFLLVFALGQCNPAEVRLELGSVEAPASGERFEIEVRAAGVGENLDALWVCGLRYDPAVIELIGARPSDAVGPNFADVFRTFPDLGRATFDYTAIPFNPRPVTPDSTGRVALAILSARMLQPVDRVTLTLTPTFLDVSGLPGEGDSRLWYCLDWRVLDEQHLGAGTVVAGEQFAAFVRGDANGDGGVSVADPLAILRTLFARQRDVVCFDTADANDDGHVNVTDAVFLIRHLFLGGQPPSGPFPAAGFDPTPDGMGCPY